MPSPSFPDRRSSTRTRSVKRPEGYLSREWIRETVERAHADGDDEPDADADADWRLKRRHDRLETYRSVVSHDLRTPLSVAQGYLDFVRSDDAEDEDELLEQVAASLDRLEAYLVDLGTLEAQGTPVEETEPVDIADIAAAAWASVETAEASLSVEATAVVAADEGRLIAAFRNVYRNAVEHGGDAVSVTVGDLDDGFFIEDDGNGPEVGGYDDLFEPGFSTTDGATGLGLAIVEQIAAAHRWRVSATKGGDGGVRIEFRNVR